MFSGIRVLTPVASLIMAVYSSLGVVRGPRDRGPLRCSERHVREVGIFLGSSRDNLLLIRQWPHGLPVDGRAGDSPRGRVLLRLDTAHHLEALEVVLVDLWNGVVLEVAGLHHFGESAEFRVEFVFPA